MYVLEGATGVDLTAFLGYGTSLMNWIVESAMSLINSLMGNPVTAVFIILALVYVVINVTRGFIRR